jgi:SAM-dependent methyltransferase
MILEANSQKSLWDRALVNLSERDCEPEPELTEFLRLGSAQIGCRGLDIGCGLGRHTLAALRMGYKITALDFSETAVRRTRRRVSVEGFEVDVRCASMDNLPFNEAEFDFAFSWCVLNHGTREVFTQAISEALRILRPSGLLFGYVMSDNDSRLGTGMRVGERCFVFTEGPERGICHYFPKKAEIVHLLELGSRIERFEEVFFSGVENLFYHPEIEHSSHFEFVAQKY